MDIFIKLHTQKFDFYKKLWYNINIENEKRNFYGNTLQKFFSGSISHTISQGGTQMKNFTMFKLNKHTYIISGSTFVCPNWDIDDSRGRLKE